MIRRVIQQEKSFVGGSPGLVAKVWKLQSQTRTQKESGTVRCQGKISNQLMLMMVGRHHLSRNDGEMQVGRVRVHQRGAALALVY